MKKVNSILIVILYLASIIVISVFGLKVDVYKEKIPVTSIECLNETDDKTEVSILGDKKYIKILFTTPGDISDPNSTILYLNCRALPDNATNKRLRYDYDKEKYGDAVTMLLDDQGHARGVFLFHKKVVFDMTITATDGTEKSTTVKIKIY